MKIKNRLYFSATVVSSLIVVLMSALLVSAYHSRQCAREYDLFENLQAGLSDLNIVLNEYVLYGEKRMEEQWAAKYSSTARQLQQLEKQLQFNQSAPAVRLIFADYAAMGDLFAKLQKSYQSKNLRDADDRKLVSRLLASSQ